MNEPPDDPTAEARRWLGVAHDDLLTAETILAHQDRAFRMVGFLAQQIAEKALKAVLVAHGLSVPHIHDLARLLR